MSAAGAGGDGWLQRFAAFDQDALAAALARDGSARLPGLFAARDAAALAARLDAPPPFALAASARGEDGQRRFAALPPPWPALHAALQACLAPIARRWNAAIGAAPPPSAPRFAHDRPAMRLAALGEGGFEALHGDDDGAFAFAVVVLLSAPERDFHGGELVTVEQRPRLQSRPAVVPLLQGDAAVLAAGKRPVAGRRGTYRAGLCRGVSRVRSGRRIAVELLLPAPAP